MNANDTYILYIYYIHYDLYVRNDYGLTVRMKMTYTFITMGWLYLCTMLYFNTSITDIAAK